MEKNTDKETPKPGEFKTKRKYTGFVSSLSGAKVRLIRETAFVKGKHLSGILEGRTFKITVCDGGTVDFEEVDGKADKHMLKRLLDDIDSMPCTGYAQKFIVQGLRFEDADGLPCYLEVEEKKPIDKLKSLFDRPEISDTGMSLLDDLLGTQDEEEQEAAEPEKYAQTAAPQAREVGESKSMLEEAFRKMNEEKAKELAKREAEISGEIQRHTRSIKAAEASIDQLREKLANTQARLETLTPGEEPNGHLFFVSELKKVETGLDESTRAVANKIAGIMKLKKEALFEYLTAGFYTITLAKKAGGEVAEEILEKAASIDPLGKFSATGPAELEYRGELDWHQIVSKLTRKGFEQDEEFDRQCGSNSYVRDEEAGL